MCGILFHLGAKSTFSTGNLKNADIETTLSNDLLKSLNLSGEKNCEEQSLFDSIVPMILARGSDYCSYETYDNDDLCSIEMFSSVLSLRPPLTQQPFRESKNSRYIIQFNGELYNKEIDSNGKHFNDIVFISNSIKENNDFITTLAQLEGEFAFCITDTVDKKVYFGKDRLGKKSLCYRNDIDKKELYVSSVHPTSPEKFEFVECTNEILYVYDIANNVLTELKFDNIEQMPGSYMVNSLVLQDADEVVSGFNELITQSVRSRIETIFPVHKSVSKFGLLFSGGIDCTLLAAIAASISPEGTVIDLLNVSFHNTRTNTSPSDTPDRKLALKSWYNLQKKYQNITFNLIEADITYEEYQLHRKRVIELIFPNDTEMDLSIAIAFYFASRGKGKRVIYEDGTNFESLKREDYQSDCKVLLSGLGADELFGGYTRHERIFTGISNQKKRILKNKPQTDITDYDINTLQVDLRDELQMDLSNLYIRNLSRDDKVISCWSKEIRYPFLDTHVIDYVTQKVPLNYKLRYDPISGEIIRKYALRLLATSKFLGLDWVADEPKRAIQFGAKSAKMELNTGKMKGTDKLSV